MAEAAVPNAAAYAVGDPVRVKTGYPRTHCRTPSYVRGQHGVVAALVGLYPNPERRAYGDAGLPETMVYRVHIPQPQLWADYPGPAGDTLVVDVFEHWLAPAPAQPDAEGQR